MKTDDDSMVARFWYYLNGWVKITVRGNEVLTWHGEEMRDCAEYIERMVSWELDNVDGIVRCIQVRHGRDSEGPFERSIVTVAALDELDGCVFVEENGESVWYPLWKREVV